MYTTSFHDLCSEDVKSS